MKGLNDIDTSTKEGKMLFILLAEITALPKSDDRSGMPDATWHPEDALRFYWEEQVPKVFDDGKDVK